MTPKERLIAKARKKLPKAARQLGLLQLGIFAFMIAGIFGSLGYLIFLYLHLALTTSFALVVQKDLRALRSRGIR